MSIQHREFAAWVAALRGALEWHLETGDVCLPVPDNFQMPFLGTAGDLPAAEGPQSHKASSPSEPALQGSPLSVPSVPQIQAPDEGLASFTTEQDTRKTSTVEPVKPCWQSIPIDVTVGGSEMAQRAGALQTLKEKIGPCTLCPLHCGRNEIVFGHGHPGARIMFIADGPGREEDGTGVPFVGEAGLLLGRMIRAMGLKRNDTYLTYLVRCHSPGVDPEAGLDPCSSFLATEIGIVKPEVIVALGELAARRLTGHSDAFPHLRGKWFDYEGIPVLPTFHPHALLQHPQSKSQVWTDLKAVMRNLGLKQQGD